MNQSQPKAQTKYGASSSCLAHMTPDVSLRVRIWRRWGLQLQVCLGAFHMRLSSCVQLALARRLCVSRVPSPASLDIQYPSTPSASHFVGVRDCLSSVHLLTPQTVFFEQNHHSRNLRDSPQHTHTLPSVLACWSLIAASFSSPTFPATSTSDFLRPCLASALSTGRTIPHNYQLTTLITAPSLVAEAPRVHIAAADCCRFACKEIHDGRKSG